MNKKIKPILAAVAAMLVIAACSSTAQQRISTGEDVVPEASSGEMLVDGLEYLLSDDKEDVIQIPETEENGSGIENEDKEDKEEKEQVEESKEEGVSDNDIADTESEEIVLYYSNGTFDSLESENVEVAEKTPEAIISALARHNIVSLDTKVLSFSEEDMVGGKILHMDLSKALDGYLRTMTKEAESVIIASITDTFLESYGADYIYITVEKKPLTTPYAVYDGALQKCMPQDLLELEDIEEETEEGMDNGQDQ